MTNTADDPRTIDPNDEDVDPNGGGFPVGEEQAQENREIEPL